MPWAPTATTSALCPSGVRSLIASKEFEAPDDAGSDGTCEERVPVSDGDSTAAALVEALGPNLGLARGGRVPLAC